METLFDALTTQAQQPNWQGRTGLPAGCTLVSSTMTILMDPHEHPCDCCYMDRAKCHGFPNRDERPASTTPARKAPISFQLFRRPKSVVRAIYEAREFAPPSFLAWLRRPLRWLWRRCSRQHFHEELVPIQPVALHVETMREAIKRLEHSIDCVWNRRCRHVVVGPEALMSLASELPDSPLSYPMDLHLANSDGKGLSDIRVFNMQVHVVPWFTGCVLLPEWKDL